MLICLYSAGMMYWGDARLKKIEAAYLNGTGRRILLSEPVGKAHYFAFLLHGSYIYFTDWNSVYGYC